MKVKAQSIAIIVALALWMSAASLQAGVDAVLDRGYNVDGLYDVHGFDDVNLFNGNLQMNVPLGPLYRTNGTLEYKFVLHYNSSFWEYNNLSVDGGGASHVIPADFFTQMNHFFDEAENRAGSSTEGTEAFISPEFNAGIGWTISLGELPSYLLYITPDGNRHGLFASLHGADPIGFDYRHAQYLYTRDGTYIRMRRIPSPSDNNVEKYRELQYPDGVRHRFACIAGCSANTGGQWMLDQIADPSGNVLWVGRAARPSSGLWTWTFVEAVRSSNPVAGSGADGYYADHMTDVLTEVRRHEIDFQVDDALYMHAKAVRLAGPNSTGSTPTMNYVLEYKENGDIYRTHASNWAGPGLVNQFKSNGKIPATLLTRVKLPPATSGAVAEGEWNFEYLEETQAAADDDPLDPADPLVQHTWGTFTYKTAWYSGMMKKVTLPTKGAIAYRWGRRGIPALACDPVRRGERRAFGKPAVAKRQILFADGTKDGKPWLYFGRGIWNTTIDCGAPREYLSTVIDPLGNTTVSFYSVYIGLGEGYWDEREYGTPVSKVNWVDSGEKIKFISTENYKCEHANFFGAGVDLDTRNDRLRRIVRPPDGVRSCGNPIRTEYIRFRNSGFNCDPAVVTSCTAVNRLVHGSRTVYHDDGDSYADTEYSDFDGLGHFRDALLSGGDGFGTATHGDYTNFNPGRSESSLPSGAAWILNTYDEKRQREGSQKARSYAWFEADTGLLRGERRLKNGASGSDYPGLSAGDVLVLYERTRDVTTPTITTFETKHFGGDVDGQNLSTDPNAKFSPNGHGPAYHQLSRLRFGTESYSEYRDNGLTVLKTADNTIDAKSGLVTATVSTAGARTTYEYDNLGRLKTVTPEPDPAGGTNYLREASIGYLYTAATGSSEDKRAQVLVKRPAGCTTNCLAQVRTTFDHLGRATLTQTMLPGDRWSRVVKQYGPTGWLDRVSTPHDTAGVIYYTSYSYCNPDPPYDCDVFGRPRRITAPDSAKTNISYGGVRTVNRQIENVKGPNGGHSVLTFEEYDRFGRLIKVSDFSDPNAGSVPTSYAYDLAGRLTDVTTSSQQQARTFRYDNRGFLSSEYHPEVGKTFRYDKIDARGHATQRTVVGAETYNLGYQYDKAERLEKVFPPINPDRPVVELKYFDSNTDACGTNAGLAIGKVRLATRHNMVPDPTVTNKSYDYPVAETYLYRGVEGRMSHRTTTVSRPNGAGDVRFRQGFRYNALGQASEIEYPVCPDCGGTGPERTVFNTYSYGLLNGVSNYATIQYHINGMISEITHSTPGSNGNGVRDVQGMDPNAMLRPMKIWTKNVVGGENWNPQGYLQYTYDGAGNVDGVVNPDNNSDPARETYRYDEVNRLVRAVVGGMVQEYAYDRWGNLTSIGGTAIGVSSSNNRLTSAVYNDGAGTVRSLGGYSYEYDLVSMMRHAYGPNLGKIFLYAPGNERIATFDYKALDANNAPTVRETWTIRGGTNQVLRVFEKLGSAWTWKKDYIYRGTKLLASTGVEGERHYHLDHLGTPRLITDVSGARVSYHAYFPFGREVTPPDSDSEAIKFTGHERDNNNPLFGARDGDLDYMHARYYTPQYGRFLSPDPMASGKPANPQTWNRFSYTRNSPSNRVDPDGETDVLFSKADDRYYVYDRSGHFVFSSPAANNVASGASGTLPRNGLESGTYHFKDTTTPHFHNAVDDAPSGAYGPDGIFRLDDFVDSGGTPHDNVGIHGGRIGVPDGQGRTGYEHCTFGCVRSEQNGMHDLRNQAGQDPLNDLVVVDGPLTIWDYLMFFRPTPQPIPSHETTPPAPPCQTSQDCHGQ